MSKFESEQFVNLVFSILINSKRRRKKTSLLILDWTDISLDLNPFRRRDLKNKPYKWGYSRDSFWHEDDDSDRLQNSDTLILSRLSCKRP